MTVTESTPKTGSDEDGEQGTHFWSIPDQGRAPSVESRTLMSAGEPEAIGTHRESLVLMPRPDATDQDRPTVTPPQAAPRKGAGRLRTVTLLSDSVVLAAFIGGGLVIETWVFSACALVIMVIVVGRGMMLDRVPSMLARTPIFKMWATVIGPACAIVALTGSARAGRELIFGGLAILAALLLLRTTLRMSTVRSLLGLPGGRRCLLVGDEQTLLPMVAERDGWPGCEDVAGILLQENPASQPDDEAPGLFVERVVSAAHLHRADRVTVVPGPALEAANLRELSWALENTGIDLEVSTELQGVAAHRVEVTQVGDRMLMRVGSATPRGGVAAVKGAIDRLGAAVLLLLLTPAILGLVLAIRRDSPGPAIFRQTRVRRGGIEFTMYKFRTMHENAEEVMHALQKLNDHGDSGVLFKMRNDPRVTRLGQVMRRMSIDELPQLINVLRGEMSLIGPRPALPSEVAQYDRLARRRLAVKPGMTGLWQVSGRSRLTWHESLRYDLDYVDNWSPARETAIALRTVKAVLNNDGAY